MLIEIAMSPRQITTGPTLDEIRSEGLARERKADGLALAHEELGSEQVLKGSDLAADGALGEAQFVGGCCEALVTGGGLEGAQDRHRGKESTWKGRHRSFRQGMR